MIIERLIIGDGSSLKEVPTGCVDVVVTTRSLCSVKSVRSVLQEIRRVLAPVRLYLTRTFILYIPNLYRYLLSDKLRIFFYMQGGKYIFVEHVPEKKGTFIRWLQIALTRTGIWPSLFGDCRLDADCIAEIENAGFEKVSWTFLALEGYVSHSFHLSLSKQHVFGIATR